MLKENTFLSCALIGYRVYNPYKEILGAIVLIFASTTITSA